MATLAHLQEEADKLTEVTSSDPEPSLSKKKRARDARKLVTRVKAALDEGRIEEDIRGVKLEKVFSKASTKQAMIARVSRAQLYLPRYHFATHSNAPSLHLCWRYT